jgi:hypothetical protein
VSCGVSGRGADEIQHASGSWTTAGESATRTLRADLKEVTPESRSRRPLLRISALWPFRLLVRGRLIDRLIIVSAACCCSSAFSLADRHIVDRFGLGEHQRDMRH